MAYSCESAGPGLVWRLVGKNPAAIRRLTEGDPRIEVVGPVEDAVAELARVARWGGGPAADRERYAA